MTRCSHPEDAAVFRLSPADRLALLQLTIRKAVGERLEMQGAVASDDADEAPSDSESPEPSPGGSASVVPDAWRLVPAGIGLHAWQRECLQRWLPTGRGTVKVATGGGKTLFALAAAEALQQSRVPDLRMAIVVPTVPLMYQWRDELLRGNLPEAAIGLLGGGHSPPGLGAVRILVTVLNSAREQLPEMVRRATWAERLLLVVDECHRANAMRAQKVFDVGALYTLGLSATPESELDAADVPATDAWNASPAGQALGPIIYEFSIRESLEAGLLTPFEVWHVGLPLLGDETGEHGRLSRQISDLRQTLQLRHRQSRSTQGFLAWCQTMAARRGDADAVAFIGLANERKRLLYRAAARREAVLHVLQDASADPESRSIVFHESIAEIECLFAAAVRRGLPVTLEHSKLPGTVRDASIDAFRRGDARSIISAKSLVEGFNVPSADVGVIAASSGSVRQRIQSLGRLLRRKAGGRTARIVVLYVRDTEDEAIYEKADWEGVIGAERNRYFTWSPPEEGAPWDAGLVESARAPRTYRPPAHSVDVSAMTAGAPYPGQVQGVELRVDDAGNLRDDKGALVPAPRELVDAIVTLSPLRRARRTPPGHVVVRVDALDADTDADWRFAGVLADGGDGPVALQPDVTYRIKSSRGRRVIALVEGGRHGTERYAKGPVAERLLAWVTELERQGSVTLRDLHWRADSGYWMEIAGERIGFPDERAPLEFPA